MSKKTAHVHSSVLHDSVTMSIEELEQTYNIEVLDDDSVYDQTEGRTFPSIHDWALYIAEQERLDEADNFSSSPSSSRWNDWD